MKDQANSDTAHVSINIDYIPNWENGHVKKRIEKVLNWAAQFCIGNRGTIIPVRLSSVILDKTFGPKGNALGDYLRAKLLAQISNSYSTTYKRCKEYHVSLSGFNEISERILNKQLTADVNTSLKYSKKEEDISTPATITADVNTSLVFDRLRKIHSEELSTNKFNMKDASSRLWHPLQNMRRKDKPKFWENYLPHNYDISACAPTILRQLAVHCGMPAIIAEAIRLYVDTKGAFRKHVSDLSGLSLDDSKRVINSLFNGAKLAKNPRCSTFQLLNYDKDRMDALAQDPQIIRLRKAIKNCWSSIERAMNRQAPRGTKFSIRKSTVKWGIYFNYERKVLEAIMQELDNQNIQYFTEHDGFRTNKVPDIKKIEQAILSSTKLELTILGD